MWEAFLGDDPVSGLLFCDPDIEWDGTNLPDGKVARGHQAVVEHATRWAEMWDDWRIEPERFIDAGGDQGHHRLSRNRSQRERPPDGRAPRGALHRSGAARSSTERASLTPMRPSKPPACRIRELPRRSRLAREARAPTRCARSRFATVAVAQRGSVRAVKTIRGWRRTSSRVIASRSCCCRRACGSGCREDHLAWFVIDAVDASWIWRRSMAPIATMGRVGRRTIRR